MGGGGPERGALGGRGGAGGERVDESGLGWGRGCAWSSADFGAASSWSSSDHETDDVPVERESGGPRRCCCWVDVRIHHPFILSFILSSAVVLVCLVGAS